MIRIYDPDRKNSFLTDIFFAAFKNQLGYEPLAILGAARNDTVIIHADNLTPALIQTLRENGNKIVACDINDSSQISFPEFWRVDLILKFAGIQTTRISPKAWLDDTLGVTKIEGKFMGDVEYAHYREVVDAGRIMSIPYIPWGQKRDINFLPYEQRRPVLVRGGNHLMRWVLFLHLASKGLLDEGSQFFATYYLHQHCDKCRETHAKEGRIRYTGEPLGCPNQPEVTPETLNEGWRWNNRCIPRFYWLAEQFAKGEGRKVDFGFLEQALHGAPVGWPEFFDLLAKYRIYADHKLIFSIYAPPRFWEAASAKTVNLVPRRTNSQLYFPEMQEGVHYLTFSEDLSDIQEVIEGMGPEQYREISENAYDLYMRFVYRPKLGHLARALAEAIRERIENV